jgi:hypothetical protein
MRVSLISYMSRRMKTPSQHRQENEIASCLDLNLGGEHIKNSSVINWLNCNQLFYQSKLITRRTIKLEQSYQSSGFVLEDLKACCKEESGGAFWYWFAAVHRRNRLTSEQADMLLKLLSYPVLIFFSAEPSLHLVAYQMFYFLIFLLS